MEKISRDGQQFFDWWRVSILRIFYLAIQFEILDILQKKLLVCRMLLIEAFSILSRETFKMVMLSTTIKSHSNITLDCRKEYKDEMYVNERFMKITHDNMRRHRGCINIMPDDRICQKLLFIRSFSCVHGWR